MVCLKTRPQRVDASAMTRPRTSLLMLLGVVASLVALGGAAFGVTAWVHHRAVTRSHDRALEVMSAVDAQRPALTNLGFTEERCATGDPGLELCLRSKAGPSETSAMVHRIMAGERIDTAVSCEPGRPAQHCVQSADLGAAGLAVAISTPTEGPSEVRISAVPRTD